ncbi:MAG: glycosyltransferase family 1 protein [Gemmatimonadaceae bacterium]
MENLSEAPAGNRLSIALDCEHERQSEAGISRTARSLAEALERRSDVVLHRLGGGPAVPRDTLQKRLVTIRQDLWWYPFAGRRAARRLHADVYHCPTPRAPARKGTTPLVVTIHDLASFRFPETLTTWTRHYERAMLPRVAKAADRILTPSENTADDVQSILGVRALKIRVVPNGVDAGFFRADESRSPLPFPYVLFVGTPQPRKNLARLAEAVEKLRVFGHDLRLVVAGADGWGGVRLSESSAHMLGRVSDLELRTLYQHAECLALVSLHEGFGLPALEAMAMGTPVVASRAAALPEVVGEAGVLVDPLSSDTIAAGILEAVERKAELTTAGRQRASGFSWELAAERTVAVYREVASV